jgi:hypothetical protein
MTPFDSPAKGCPYYLRPWDDSLAQQHLALLNEAERLERLSSVVLRGQRLDRLAKPEPGSLDVV